MEPCYKGESWLNKRVGLYTVVGSGEKAQYTNQQVTLWKVKCDCGCQKQISKWHIIYGKVSGCCNCIKDRVRFDDCKNWNSTAKNVTGMYFHKIRKAAEKRSIPFLITREEMDDVFQSQSGKCRYLGVSLTFETHGKRGTASLDRINSKLGYSKDNIQWVHKDVNTIKWDLSHEDFVRICKTISENFNG